MLNFYQIRDIFKAIHAFIFLENYQKSLNFGTFLAEFSPKIAILELF